MEGRAAKGSPGDAGPFPPARALGRGGRGGGRGGALARVRARRAGKRAPAPRRPAGPAGGLHPRRRGVDWRTGHRPSGAVRRGEDHPGAGPGGRRRPLLLGRVRGAGRPGPGAPLRAPSECSYAPGPQAPGTRPPTTGKGTDSPGSCGSDGILHRGAMETRAVDRGRTGDRPAVTRGRGAGPSARGARNVGEGGVRVAWFQESTRERRPHRPGARGAGCPAWGGW
jgi:hypothetical protein